jgi:hypothetical protein
MGLITMAQLRARLRIEWLCAVLHVLTPLLSTPCLASVFISVNVRTLSDCLPAPFSLDALTEHCGPMTHCPKELLVERTRQLGRSFGEYTILQYSD